jgi:glucuronoarabinoxylan endo-1,4-beta-xylanase
MGKEISILIDDKDKARGLHQIKWDASNFPSGLYFVMIQAGSLMESKKIILIK